ncbi:SufE family protein [Aureibacter tunicatorum]|uniref:Cysteine desulfuration protein SufE n=1 Tax=Aureibacter tunicatorum TaxID=866807 RepID=A0AAE3XNA3_9BACT|nr:SufE family protein [Aureibacter tunicatorum]MDR6239645.1 cysteine desulfuration protein SufE [Aureibacter tunicatorum]BDD04121.1 Fe-S metabolism protein SufE [Aureibacter tunicatorum]
MSNNLSVYNIQDQIVEEFQMLGDDRESMIFYIMELGQQLPALEEEYKVDQNLIKGCQSKVWLHADFDGEVLTFKADSNTDITKGLISLLLRVLSGRKLNDIINAELNFIDRIGMGGIIGSQRSNGLAAMIKQIKLYALAYKSKLGV